MGAGGSEDVAAAVMTGLSVVDPGALMGDDLPGGSRSSGVWRSGDWAPWLPGVGVVGVGVGLSLPRVGVGMLTLGVVLCGVENQIFSKFLAEILQISLPGPMCGLHAY